MTYIWSCRYTGFVTAGGAVCLAALAPPGQPGSWRPDYCFQGVLNTAINAMWVSPRFPAVSFAAKPCAKALHIDMRVPQRLLTRVAVVLQAGVPVHVKTASGGGIGGPLRVDLESRFSAGGLEKYSEVGAVTEIFACQCTFFAVLT